MKQKHKWQIDDLVYFLDQTSQIGEFPMMYRGIIEELKRDCVRVILSFKNHTNLVWVDNDKVFASTEDLMEALKVHMAKQAYICDNPDQVDR